MNEAYTYLYFDSIDSTNTHARRLLDSDALKLPAVLVAGEQTAGRGRHGNSFYSPAETGIYMSVVIAPGCAVNEQVTLTTRVAVAAARAVEKTTGTAPEIKWVNDLYLGGRKICGILCEAVNDYEKNLIKAVIIGIGINLTTRDFPEEIRMTAGSLAGGLALCEEPRQLKDRLTRAVAEEVLAETADLSDLSYLEYYKAHSGVLGREITYTEDGRLYEATAMDIDSEGGLIVECGGIRKTLNSGEISLRLKQT